MRNGHVALIGDEKNPMLGDINNQFLSMNYRTKFYQSEKGMNDYIRSSDYNDDVCLGVNIV